MTTSEGEYRLASGFQTTIRSDDSVNAAIHNLRSVMIAKMDMLARFGSDQALAVQLRTKALASPKVGPAGEHATVEDALVAWTTSVFAIASGGDSHGG